jgi:hypothetical protein
LPGRRAPQAVIRKGAAPVAQSGIAREAGPGFRKCSIQAAGHHSIFKQQSRHCERKRSNPAFGPGCKGYRFESGLRRSGIFFRRGLDKIMGDLPVQQDDDNRPGSAPSAVHGRAWTKNRENNPMQSKADPACGTRAAMRPGKENAPSSRPQPNFIPLRTRRCRRSRRPGGAFVPV